MNERQQDKVFFWAFVAYLAGMGSLALTIAAFVMEAIVR